MADFKRSGHWRTTPSGDRVWIEEHGVSRSDFGSSSAECDATNKIARHVRTLFKNAGENIDKIAQAWLVLGLHLAEIAFRNDPDIFKKDEIEKLDDARKLEFVDAADYVVRSFEKEIQRKLGILMGDEKDKFTNYFFRETEHAKLTRMLRNRINNLRSQKLRIFVKPKPDEQ